MEEPPVSCAPPDKHGSTLASLRSALHNSLASAAQLEADVAALGTRASRALARLRSECDLVLAALVVVPCSRKSKLNSIVRQLDEKLLAERAEEASSNADCLTLSPRCARLRKLPRLVWMRSNCS
jgi:hypothetical protein